MSAQKPAYTVHISHQPLTPDVAQMSELLTAFNTGDLARSINDCEAFIRLYPEHFFGYKLLGATYERQNQWWLAMQQMQKAAQLNPNDAENLGNLAKVYKDLGQLNDAIATYQKALAFNPTDVDVIGKYIFALNYLEVASPERMREFTQRLGTILSEKATHRYQSWPRHSDAPLRVGLVSGDLKRHPVGFFLENVLAHLDANTIQIHAYPTVLTQDEVSTRLRAHCTAWTPIHADTDQQAAERIHQDQMDVLIDLSGLSAHHRLGVFGYQPAPIQISWLGYFATTGLPQMHYLLADEISVTPAQEAHFTERIVRLPHTRLCYGGAHLDEAPEVSPLPAFSHPQHVVTFGCFQNLAKITDEVLRVWARILHQLPNARLRIQNKPLGLHEVRAQFLQRCVQHGMDSKRIELHPSAGYDDYLRTHGEVDLILDTFPFPGGTTTCEALWMGVPTLTLCGERMISRQGASMLHAAGLDDWIAPNLAQYERMALTFARNLPALATMRSTLRERVRHSTLFDAKGFAHDWTQTLQQIHAAHLRSD